MVVSIAYGANNARTSVGVYALMHSIYKSGKVAHYAQISWQLRCMGAVGMGLGTLFCGFRLVPVTGMPTKSLHDLQSAVWFHGGSCLHFCLSIVHLLACHQGNDSHQATLQCVGVVVDKASIANVCS